MYQILYAIVMTLLFLSTMIAVASPPFSIPPTLGNVTESSATILLKTDLGTPLHLIVMDEQGEKTFESTVAPDPDADGKVLFEIQGLQSGHDYDYFIHSGSEKGQPLRAASFSTQAAQSKRAPVALAFASCANESAQTAAVWDRMRLEKTDAVFLIGDTPYIDSTDLAHQRKRYKEFASVGSLARLLATTPVYSTWDDHDFGKNDTDGRLEGKENSRKAFLESRPNPSPAEETNGIYTKIQIGDVEVFLLDARWFARTEVSTFDPTKPSLLGKTQWKWLRENLQTSTATWKIITTGMIFNSAVRPLKTDYWMHYPHELNGLFELLGELKISGAVLMGGDIHRQRVVRHASKEIVGYDLIELISSPAHDHIIASANAPHPGLLFDGGKTHVFIDLRSEPGAIGGPQLRSRIMRADGEVLDERWLKASDFASPF